MVELIFTITLVLSLVGLGIILFRKMPDLVKIKEPVFRNKEKAKIFTFFSDFSYELYLQKILSRIRVLTLKTDSKTSGWLEKLRQLRQKRNQEIGNNDKYWEELKKAKDGK